MAGLIPGIENIGRRERRKRLFMGFFMFLVAIGLAVALVVSQVYPLWRLTVALPVFLAGLGYFQARTRTCVYHAARGTCNLDQGDQPLTDLAARAQLVRQAKMVVFLSLAFATLVSVAITVLPI